MALEEERRARERAESAAREARALADEREKRITAHDKELQDRQGRGEGTGKTRATPKRRSKPEG